jgi:Uma2 family endonuclease
MVQTPVKIVTLAEFLLLPETKPAIELIDGQIIQKPMPQGKHSLIQIELGSNINTAFKPQRLVRASTELRCSFGDRSLAKPLLWSLVPDVTVFTSDSPRERLRQRIPRDENGDIANVFSIAPDWTIEILSPNQSYTKVTKNILKHGTQMGWLIDPAEQSVFFYVPDRSTQVLDEAIDLLPVPEFAKDFKLTLGKLFEWLSE